MKDDDIDAQPFGRARYATPDEVKRRGLTDSSAGGVPLGQLVHDGEITRTLVNYSGERHALLFGPNGSGKSLRVLVPYLLSSTSLASPRSFVVIDPKGELAAITAKHLAKYLKVYIVNPFGFLTKRPGYEDLASCGYNPLVSLKPGNATFNADAGLIAEALFSMEGTQPFFPRMARNLGAGLVMFDAMMATFEHRAPSLGNVRDQIVNPTLLIGENGEPGLITRMIHSKHRGIRNKIAPLQQAARSRMDVINEAAAQTEFLDDPEIIEDMEKVSDLDFARMKDEPTVVFLIMPGDMMERHAKWFKLVLSAALRAHMTPKRASHIPITYILEEFFLLASGGLKVVESVMAFVRGFGIQLMPVLQDLNQLIELYPQRWQTFLANAGVIAAFGPNDLTSADWMSRRAGQATVQTVSENDNKGQNFGPDQKGFFQASANKGGGLSYGQSGVPFLSTHDLIDTPEGYLFVWRHNFANTVLTHVPIYAAKNHPLGIAGLARANPYYGG